MLHPWQGSLWLPQLEIITPLYRAQEQIFHASILFHELDTYKPSITVILEIW